MSVNMSYKQIHESFMQNLNGTSVWENISIITPAPIMVYFVVLFNFCILDKILLQFRVKNKALFLFLAEFVFLVTFIILQLTLCSNYINVIAFFFIIAYIAVIKRNMKAVDKSFFSTLRKTNQMRPFITYFRSIISVISCICILAVDFHIFPRRLAKTETFGYGLMDTGVGFYIVANGITTKPTRTINALWKSILNTLPILFLGIIRFLFVESIDYQKHVSEYGLHWNFFFTLAFVKIIGACLIHIYPDRSALMGLFTAIIHQIILSSFSEKWVLENSVRSNIITANKEGLVSILGYVSLYLCSISLGFFLANLPNPRIVDDLLRGIFNLIWAIIFLVFTLIFHKIFDVSRRLANITYIIWIFAMSLFGLSLSIFSEIALRFSLQVITKSDELLVPSLYQAVNYNSLLYFLVSNILTGVINLIFKTFYADYLFSIFIMIIYQLVACGIMYVLYLYEIKIKF